MSVLLETTEGDIVIDLYTKRAPTTCLNFLKLCKIKYYNFSAFHRIEKDFTAQTGDPHFDGGSSIFGLLGGLRYFPAEIHPKLKHKKTGTVSMAVAEGEGDEGGGGVSGSQFFFTLRENLDYLDGKYTVFGQVAEGLEVLEKLSRTFVDENYRPFKDVRIKHTIILDDPFPDPPGLQVPNASPLPTPKQLASVRIDPDSDLDVELTEELAEEREKQRRAKEAAAQALTLEMIGDLPFAEIKPPENVLFVCKLNPVTQDEDLELIFSRFGKITSCEVIRDRKTGDSLSYAFIEYERQEDAEAAYFKMDNVLVDDRRIHVDFSQSVSKLHRDWVLGRRRASSTANAAEDGAVNEQLVGRQRYRVQERSFAGAEEDNSYDLIFEHADGTAEEVLPIVRPSRPVFSSSSKRRHSPSPPVKAPPRRHSPPVKAPPRRHSPPSRRYSPTRTSERESERRRYSPTRTRRRYSPRRGHSPTRSDRRYDAERSRR